jgi:hypothetical protein
MWQLSVDPPGPGRDDEAKRMLEDKPRLAAPPFL